MLPRALPASRSERWSLLDALLEAWFPPPIGAQGVATRELDAAEERLSVPLPAALREWYERYGARSDVWSLQDHLRAPTELSIEDGGLCFCTENQHVVSWGVLTADLAVEDPKVVLADGPGGAAWTFESQSVSEFALAYALMNVKWSGSLRHCANGPAPEAIEAVERSFTRLPIADLNWPATPTRFYGHAELLIECNGDWLWMSARSRRAFQEADKLLRSAGVQWEHCESTD